MQKVSSSYEDYLEMILMLGGDKTGVKSVNIAQKLGVSKPAVCLACNNMLEEGLIEKVIHGGIRLTADGEEIARKILEKHQFIYQFLLLIGVSEKVACIECCKMEHCLEDETLECLKKFCAERF